MQASDKSFTGSIAETYERYMVPLLFEPYANDLSRRVAALRPRNVLETAAGTGVLTRAIAALSFPEMSLVATDLNQPMLEMANARQPPGSNVTWHTADAMALPFEDQRFDTVVCQFGVMFFPDKLQGYRESLRVLRPGGQFLFNVWDRISENAFADAVTAALGEVFHDDPPTFMARTPHGYFDTGRISNELREAGFTSVMVETVGHVSKAASPRDVAIAMCQGTPLRNEILARDPARLDDVTRHVTDALARQFGTGPVEGKIKAHVFAAAR